MASDGDARRPGLGRRSVLAGGAAGLLSGLLPAAPPALAQGSPTLPADGAPFTGETVPDLARALARIPYAPQRTDDLPEALRSLNREQYAAIRTAPGAAIWSEAGLPFTVEPLHRGFVYTDRVALYRVEEGTARAVPYARDRFEADGLALPEPGQADPGFSGFRVNARFDGGEPVEFALFQGISFFRLIARGQAYGVNGRALMLRPADPRGEDFPRWRAFFLERPAPDAPELTVHALVDAQSCTAAFRFVLRPGETSTVTVEARLFVRTAIDHLGLGGMQSPYLFGPHDPRGADDIRVAAHASGGLQIRNGGDEAIWRPVRNPGSLQISSFLDEGPKGFGLMQRQRDYLAFQDDVQRWELRPSLWIEPGDAEGIEGLWGAGAVTLIEIPSDAEVNENVIAYWRPQAVIPAGAELTLRYRQSWCWQPPDPPPVAIVAGTRGGRGAAAGRRLFHVDYAGEVLFPGPDGEPLALRVVVGASQGRITRQALYFYPERRTVRVAFELDPAGERASELRLVLMSGDTQVSETWLYRWIA